MLPEQASTSECETTTLLGASLHLADGIVPLDNVGAGNGVSRPKTAVSSLRDEFGIVGHEREPVLRAQEDDPCETVGVRDLDACERAFADFRGQVVERTGNEGAGDDHDGSFFLVGFDGLDGPGWDGGRVHGGLLVGGLGKVGSHALVADEGIAGSCIVGACESGRSQVVCAHTRCSKGRGCNRGVCPDISSWSSRRCPKRGWIGWLWKGTRSKSANRWSKGPSKYMRCSRRPSSRRPDANSIAGRSHGGCCIASRRCANAGRSRSPPPKILMSWLWTQGEFALVHVLGINAPVDTRVPTTVCISVTSGNGGRRAGVLLKKRSQHQKTFRSGVPSYPVVQEHVIRRAQLGDS